MELKNITDAVTFLAQEDDLRKQFKNWTGKIRYHLMMIGPELAKQMMSLNYHKNRKLKAQPLAKIMRDMKTNHFKFNGAPIIFDELGYLMDGQHRLEAIIRTGIPALCAVLTLMPRAHYLSVDTQQTGKSFADALAHEGFSDTHRTTVAAAWKYIHGIATSGMPDVRFSAKDENTVTTIWDMLETIEPYRKKIQECVAEGVSVYWRSGKLFYATVLSAMSFIIKEWGDRKDPETLSNLDYFMEGLATGENLSRGNPILALRKRGIKIAEEKALTRQGASTNVQWALLVKTWNFLCVGKEINILLYNPMKESKPLLLRVNRLQMRHDLRKSAPWEEEEDVAVAS